MGRRCTGRRGRDRFSAQSDDAAFVERFISASVADVLLGEFAGLIVTISADG